jgi:hypothetical protein
MKNKTSIASRCVASVRQLAQKAQPLNLTYSALVAHGYLPLFARVQSTGNAVGASDERASRDAVATVVANMAYFGYAPSLAALSALRAMSAQELSSFWAAVEPSFKNLSGADRKMDNFVVYKNFPGEVLAMSEGQYWFSQILMYLGAPNEWFAQEALERPALDERLKLKVLADAGVEGVERVFALLCANKARWTDDQKAYALHLAKQQDRVRLQLSAFGFKENGIRLMAQFIGTQAELDVQDATDVLRLAAAMSGAEPSLREAFKFRAFTRQERRTLLGMLAGSKHLLADMGLRPALWKRLLARLHPGDFKFHSVIEAYHALYNGDYQTFNGEVEAKLASADASVLALLSQRPGDFLRRLHKVYAVFGMAAVHAFAEVADKLDTLQLLKLRTYVVTVNGRLQFIHPPKGNWGKARFVANEKKALSHQAVKSLTGAIDAVLAARMAKMFPKGVALADETADIKLQTNDQELAPYGRGTVFHIPKEMTFVRTASYWAHKGYGNTWFDNGVCFFDENWAPAGTCCWNTTHEMGNAAVFSGDPTNSKDLKGRACQMIDLYLDRLAARGVRYAVWNVLCFSNVPFSQAEDVLATLQWGESAEKGKLYEPSRAQMVFPLKGDNKVKYVAYIDVVERKLVYMDANFAGSVQSAKSNEASLAQRMPAFVEYLNALPSVADLFMNAPQGKTPVLYSDAGHKLRKGEKAYVFKPENADNQFEALALAELL